MLIVASSITLFRVVRLHSSLVASVVLSVVAGCNDPASCVEVSAEAIDLEDGTPESMSAVALLQSNEGRYQASLTWLGSEIAEDVDVVPRTGTTDLQIELRRSGRAHHVRYERMGGHPHERLACPNVIELGLELRMLSGDGALDGAWTMVVSEPDGAGSRVAVVVDPTSPENDGDFAARPSQAWEPGSLQVEAASVFDGGHVQGHIEIRARPQGGDDEGTALRATAARWTGVLLED